MADALTIPDHRLDAIEGAVYAMNMSVAEQRELVRVYRQAEALRAALYTCIDVMRRSDADTLENKANPPDSDEWDDTIARGAALLTPNPLPGENS